MRVTGSDGLLLTYLNSTDSEYDVADILKAKTEASKTGEVTEEEKQTYNSIKTSAAKVQSDASALLVTGDESLFTKAETSGSTVDILTSLGSFVDDYNAMVKELAGTKDKSNDDYLEELKSIFNNAKDSLETVGLSMNSDGTISIDQGKLQSATVTELKSACQDSGFLDKVTEKCDYIGANAAVDVYLANASNYTSSGAYANNGSSTGMSSMMAELYNTIGSCFDSQS